MGSDWSILMGFLFKPTLPGTVLRVVREELGWGTISRGKGIRTQEMGRRREWLSLIFPYPQTKRRLLEIDSLAVHSALSLPAPPSGKDEWLSWLVTSGQVIRSRNQEPGIEKGACCLTYACYAISSAVPGFMKQVLILCTTGLRSVFLAEPTLFKDRLESLDVNRISESPTSALGLSHIASTQVIRKLFPDLLSEGWDRAWRERKRRA